MCFFSLINTCPHNNLDSTSVHTPASHTHTHTHTHTHAPPTPLYLQVKSMAAVLLRRIFLQLEYKDVVEDIAAEILQASKAELLLSLQTEGSAYVRRKICDAIAEMARSYLGVCVCVSVHACIHACSCVHVKQWLYCIYSTCAVPTCTSSPHQSRCYNTSHHPHTPHTHTHHTTHTHPSHHPHTPTRWEWAEPVARAVAVLVPVLWPPTASPLWECPAHYQVWTTNEGAL